MAQASGVLLANSKIFSTTSTTISLGSGRRIGPSPDPDVALSDTDRQAATRPLAASPPDVRVFRGSGLPGCGPGTKKRDGCFIRPRPTGVGLAPRQQVIERGGGR